MKKETSTRRKLLTFITSSALIFYAISGFTALINYVFYPVISRLVSVEEYGEIQFLVSSFNQLAVGFVVLNVLAIILALKANSNADKNEKLHSLNVAAGTFAAILSVVGVAVLIIYSEQLQLSQPLAIVALGLSLLVNVPLTTAIGHLQGLGRFVAAGIVGLSAAIAKLVFSIVFVAIGWGVTGAVIGIVIGMLCAVILGYLFLDIKAIRRPFKSVLHHFAELSHIKYQAVVGLFALSLLTFLSTVDLIASRVILSVEEAGQYAAMATLAKIILAIGSPLMWLALPLAVNGQFKQICRYILLTTIICSALILLFSINPSTIISISMGINPDHFAALLPLASISMTLYAVAFILIASLLCLDKVRSLVFISVATLVVAIAISFSLMATNTLTVTTTLLMQAVIGIFICSAGAFSLYKTAREHSVR